MIPNDSKPIPKYFLLVNPRDADRKEGKLTITTQADHSLLRRVTTNPTE